MIPMVKKFPCQGHEAGSRKKYPIFRIISIILTSKPPCKLLRFVGWLFYAVFLFFAVNFPDGFQCHRSRRFFADKKTKPQPYG
jgi:hypothetical protein